MEPRPFSGTEPPVPRLSTTTSMTPLCFPSICYRPISGFDWKPLECKPLTVREAGPGTNRLFPQLSLNLIKRSAPAGSQVLFKTRSIGGEDPSICLLASTPYNLPRATIKATLNTDIQTLDIGCSQVTNLTSTSPFSTLQSTVIYTSALNLALPSLPSSLYMLQGKSHPLVQKHHYLSHLPLPFQPQLQLHKQPARRHQPYGLKPALFTTSISIRNPSQKLDAKTCGPESTTSETGDYEPNC